MMTITRSLMVAASVIMGSTVGVLAQVDHDAGAPGGAVSPPPPYPSRAAEQGAPAANNPHVPGATGNTVVPGDTSSLAKDSRATVEQKTGQINNTGR